ncbi:hypothetical protein GCM10017673_00630 [Streptosporangium violaceochromogenes]|nr:hypothetical protein GCM10017673_00630 [Streptosporangium violaceochromogenes]
MTPPPRRRRRTPAAPPSAPRSREPGLAPFQRRLLVVVGSVAGVVIAVAAFVLAVTAVGNDFAPKRATAAAVSTQPRPDSYRGWASPRLFAPIARSGADPAPLTLKDVFAARTVKEGRLTLRLSGTRLDADCSAAAWGELAARLAQAGCTQAARGSYLSADGRYVAQYTLFNLRDTASADALVRSLGAEYRGGWVVPLGEGRAVFPAGGHTEASGHAMGHYAGLVWIGRADGAEPGAKDDFVSLSLAVRGAEKAVFRRVVAVAPGAAPPS